MLLLPEILITLVAFALLTLDIAWKGDERSAKLLPWLTVGGALVGLVAVFFVWTNGAGGPPVATDINGTVPMMAVDNMAFFFKMLALLTVALVGLSAVDYVNTHTPFRGEFYVLTLFAGLSLMFLAGAVNLIMIYLAFEFLSITSYILTGYLRQDARSTEASMKYFLYGALASAVMLYGFSLLYGATGSVDLITIAVRLGNSNPVLVVSAIILIMVGFGFKIALAPFHQWSPDAYEGAPTPITAFLSVGPKAAGLAALIRIMVVALPAYSANWTAILSLLAILTMSVGNLIALWQTNMKRLLAYSSIAQAGYMIIGLAAWTASPTGWPGGVAGILLYLFAYVFTNLGLFTIIIIMENKTGSANTSEYAGLIRRSPLLSIAALVFFLSLIGIPPTGGFMGKLFIFGAALHQGLYDVAAVGIINSVISVYYYLGVARRIFFDQNADESPIQPGMALNVVVGFTMVMTLLIALYGDPFIILANGSTQILAGF
jgi:proton-translocating NADH-quinone oxidoreductase chain N